MRFDSFAFSGLSNFEASSIIVKKIKQSIERITAITTIWKAVSNVM